jgi:predicted Zn-dependent peptidase
MSAFNLKGSNGALTERVNGRGMVADYCMNYQRMVLPNGLRLLTAPMPGMRSASIAFSFSVGSRYEQDHVAGVSHFIEHMLFKGSLNYPTARHISDAIEGVGGTFNASTGKELTSYIARVPAEYLPIVMDVLTDMLRRPLFDSAEVEKERSVIIEELNATRDDPQEWVNLLADEVMWPGLPLGRDDAGTVETVRYLERQQMLGYLEQYYLPNSLVISIAGNIDQRQVIEATKAAFADWRMGERPRWRESLPPRDTVNVKMIQKETEQTNLCLTTLGVAYSAPDYPAFMLVNALLGDGMSSRLFQSIREEQGLAYDVGSYFNSYHETGNLVVSAGTDPARAENATQAIVAELNRLCHVLVPPDELERIKAYVRGGILLLLEGTQQVACWLASQECLHERVRDLKEIVAAIDAVTAQDMQRVAMSCFAPVWRRLALIGPDDISRTTNFGKLLTSG